ncbi:MAG TPA: hypothetical protein VGQ75_00030 [Thermoanaerobaculia bacterium]|jgi:hypothetical protein|nr:hypothetical protein [Thermoanaerobaculia bacterium]
MARNLFALLVAGCLLAAMNCATHPETKVKTEGSETVIKQTGPGENVKTTIVTGVVTKYEPGNELEIRPADGNMHDFVLEDSVQIQGAIVIGQPVTVTYTDVGGKKHATIIAAGSPTP